jgi:MFS family permease
MSSASQAVMGSVVAFIALFIADAHGVPRATAAAMASLTAFAGLFSSPVGGWLSDRYGPVPVASIVCLLAGPLVILLSFSPGPLAIGVVIIAVGTVGHVRMPVTESFLIQNTADRSRSSWLGLYYFAGSEATGLMTPFLGLLIDNYGFQTSFNVLAGAILLVSTGCVILLRQAPKPK